MFEVIKTATFEAWFTDLKDRTARARILARLVRVAAGNLGDHKALQDGVCELRVDHGPGYRLYYVQRGRVLVVLLCGGDKRTQATDIRGAVKLAQEWAQPEE